MGLDTLAVDFDDVFVGVYSAAQLSGFTIDRNNSIQNPFFALPS